MKLWKQSLMRPGGLVVAFVIGAGLLAGQGQPAQDQAAQGLLGAAWALERGGQAEASARRVRDAAASAPNDPSTLRALAQYLDSHSNADARQVYQRLLDALDRSGAPAAERVAVARRLTALDLLAGDRTAANRHLAAFTAAGGTGLQLGAAPSSTTEYIEIPGPLRSFARMAALSPTMAPHDLLPALGRNIVTNGYRALGSNQALEQTEYLTLLLRYLSQARELERLAGAEKVIRISQCESSETGVLLRVIGYRMRGGCGAEVILETINASRAFLTTDSGFPLAELELALRTNRPFELEYHPSRVPILYGRDYWQPAKDQMERPFIDFFVSDPSLARLYTGISKLDPRTAELLRAAIPAQRFKLFAHVLDFYGAMFRIREGKAVVPGGARSERIWAELNGGTGTDKGAAFFERILMQDDGWLASYFDALARIDGPVQNYLTDPQRLKRFYEALRGKVTSPGPARPVFRANTDMLMLTTRLHLDADGKPHLPGGLETWKRLFADPPEATKFDSKIKKDALGWKDPDEVIEAMFGLSRKQSENDALKIYLALSDLNRGLKQRLEPNVAERLAREYYEMSAQYTLFSESPDLTGATMIAYLDTAGKIEGIRNQQRRANSAGMMQALAGLWQIFVRQKTLPAERADAALAAVLAPFLKIDNERDLFDAGRAGVISLLNAAHPTGNATRQEHMMDLLAGTSAPAGSDAYQQLAQDLIRIFEAQRLVDLDTLFSLADNLENVSRGQPLDPALVGRLANRVSDITLPQADLTRQEKNAGAFGYWTEQHIDDQRKLNLRRQIERAGTDADKLAEVRGELAAILRDTLVGFNYMHYAPPGAQILLTNPLFVRSHDFLGYNASNQMWRSTTMYGSGWPRNAGGRLVGSLAGLPYTLAQAEQNFLIPATEGSLIWGDLVPQMMLTAVVPRWWNVTPTQTHWVGIHMAYAENLFAEAALDQTKRIAVMNVLDVMIAPDRVHYVDDALRAGDVPMALQNVMPSELFTIARQLATADSTSTLAAEIRRVAAEAPVAVSDEAISQAFGTPKPTLANSYRPELLNIRTLPTLMGYSSRILAESWESNLLYFAALADQIHAEPDALNVLVPEWTMRASENIFATHLEDWPALLRSLRAVGDSVQSDAARLAQTSTISGGNAQ